MAGTVRYSTSQKTLLLCDGSAWLPLLAAGKGYVASYPGRHCLDILNSGELLITAITVKRKNEREREKKTERITNNGHGTDSLRTGI